MASFVQACCKGLNESHLTLRRAISFEVQGGCRNTFYRTMRFSNFLHSNLLECCSRSKYTSAQKLLQEVTSYSTTNMLERSKILNEVSVCMGYSSIQDLIEKEKYQKEPDGDAYGMVGQFDFTLACSRFPCIKFGDTSAIELYEGPHEREPLNLLLPEGRNSYFPFPVCEESAKFDKLEEALQLLDPQTSHVDSTSSNEGSSHVLQHDSQAADSDGETELDVQVNCKKTRQTAHINSLDANLTVESVLDKTIKCLPNATSRQYSKLEKSGFHTVRKLLHHFPRTYADLQNVPGAIEDGQHLIFVGTILSSRGIKAGSYAIVEVVVACELPSTETDFEAKSDKCAMDEKKKIYLHLKRFFRGTRFTYQPFLRNVEAKYEKGQRVYVSGKVKQMRTDDHFEMKSFNIDMLQQEEEQHAHAQRRPYPVYPLKVGLEHSFLRDVILRALKILPTNIDPIPNEILEEFNILNLCDAYNGIHNPKSLSEADLARRRLIFDEFFYLQLARLFQMLESLGTRIEREELLNKFKSEEFNVVRVEEWCTLTKMMLKALPYSLTRSQLNAVSEIIYDLRRPVPMNRLVQGDVGCGKTVVAFLACMEVIASGFQAAFMVPTELLAAQHFDHLHSLLGNLEVDHCKPSIALLTGSVSSKQSRSILKGLQTGDISMVIGTHSLIAEKVEFSALRIAVVDEQHRFGVIQRGRFNNKLYSVPTSLRLNCTSLDESSKDKVYMAPHVLAMSATPIPRTLALALYGDMSLTQIKDLPPGRKPVETFALEGNEIGLENVFQMMHDELTAGGKVYVVYPVIEKSEQLPHLRAAAADFASVSEKFIRYKCGLLHGRMKSEDKDEALEKFRSGETRILLATQVIEIGIDVPDASMMVVMNAERFGIAQLHQLRGRVGRGERKSKCVFLSSTSASLDRLKILEKSSDAFYLANADLFLRGPGNLLGEKQSGHIPEFPVARLEIDGNILQEAHSAAMKVLSISINLESFPKLKAELSMRQPLCLLGD